MRYWIFLVWVTFYVPLLVAAEPFGMALQVSGEVLVTRDILEFEAQVEEVLMWDDEIETGDDSSLQLVFDSSFLSIGPNTLLHFEKRKGEKNEDLMVMVLEKGSFRSKILNLGSRQFFEVESEGGRLRVHGTDFVTSFDPDQGEGFGVSVLQGRVEVTSSDQGHGGEGEQGVDGTQNSTEPTSIMLTQNKRGGIAVGGEEKPVSQISYAQVDEIKERHPVPGDENANIVMEDLGMKNVALEAFVETIKEAQKDLPTESPLDPGPSEIALRLDFSIINN